MNHRRARLSESLPGTKIEIPPPSQPWLRLFLPVWLAGWTVGEVAAIVSIVGAAVDGTRPMEGPAPFLVFWVILWTAAGAFTWLALLYQIWGREVVLIDDRQIVRRYELLRWHVQQAFDLASVTRLRFSPPVFRANDFGYAMQPWGFGGGSIAFEHSGKTRRFGQSLSEDESLDLISEIRRRVNIPDH